MSASHHRIVIVGGGFGGLYAAKALAGAPAQLTVIDKRNFHLFQPLLYQVATGGLSPANIAVPLRAELRKQKNTRVLLGEVTGFDLQERTVQLADGTVPYDSLIVATGSSHHYFGKDAWASIAPGLKTVEDATRIRRVILLAFEKAERLHDSPAAAEWLNFVIVGGGPTGVELAGAIAEISRETLREDFRDIRPEEAQILLLEMADRILPTYPPDLSRKAEEALNRLGVSVRTSTAVKDLSGETVVTEHAGVQETIRSRTVLWAAGVRASPLTAALAEASGIELDRMSRIPVGPDLSLSGHREVFVVGDMARFEQNGQPLPAVAPVAMQQGRFVGKLLALRLAGSAPSTLFKYHDRGSMATVGRSYAVADLGRLKLSGFAGWITWLFIHLLNLAQFQNRVLVFLQWAWSYFRRSRPARLITGTND